MKTIAAILFLVLAISQTGCVATYDANGIRVVHYEDKQQQKNYCDYCKN